MGDSLVNNTQIEASSELEDRGTPVEISNAPVSISPENTGLAEKLDLFADIKPLSEAEAGKLEYKAEVEDAAHLQEARVELQDLKTEGADSGKTEVGDESNSFEPGNLVSEEEVAKAIEYRKTHDPEGKFFIPLEDIPKSHFTVLWKSETAQYNFDIYQSLTVTSQSLVNNKECIEALNAYKQNPTQETAQHLADTIQEYGNWILWDKPKCKHGNNPSECAECNNSVQTSSST